MVFAIGTGTCDDHLTRITNGAVFDSMTKTALKLETKYNLEIVVWPTLGVL